MRTFRNERTGNIIRLESGSVSGNGWVEIYDSDVSEKKPAAKPKKASSKAAKEHE